VFAGAAREAVFANPEIVRRVNADFIPVALKAVFVNNPPGGAEGRLYAELNRTKAAPQGICVANSAGKALAWALSFDDEASIGKFLDYAQQRYQDSADSKRPVTTQRFMKFPSNKMSDVADTSGALTIPAGHEAAERCPALPAVERGTLVGRIIGRPLDDKGQPIQQTLRQEDYMEARFEIPVAQQEQLARTLAAASDGESFAVPHELARMLVSHAYLGQLDVNPLGGRQTGGKTDSESIEFRAIRAGGDGPGQTLYITGTSHVEGGAGEVGIRTDGRSWEHRVQLTWEGYLDIVDNRITRLVLSAQGTEQLRWGSQRWKLNTESDVAHLMAGHPIDLDCRVCYGLTAEPAAEEEVGSRATAGFAAALPRGDDGSPPAQQIQQQIRRLRESGQNEQADRLEQAARNRNLDAARLGTIEQRLVHLREAVKHLRAAGVDELADQIARQVQRLEQTQARDRDASKK
jgi:hypothetical protein